MTQYYRVRDLEEAFHVTGYCSISFIWIETFPLPLFGSIHTTYHIYSISLHIPYVLSPPSLSPSLHPSLPIPLSPPLSLLKPISGGVMYQYFVKIVPTVYKNTSGSVSPPLSLSLQASHVTIMWSQVLKTNQFSVTKHKKVSRAQHGDSGLPGVFVVSVIMSTDHVLSL